MGSEAARKRPEATLTGGDEARIGPEASRASRSVYCDDETAMNSGWKTRRLTVLLVLAGVLGLGAAASAQGGFFGRFFNSQYEPPIDNAKYDGRFTFLRLKFDVGPGGYYYRSLPAWAHGFEYNHFRADDNLMRIMDEISALHPHVDKTNVLAIDDPELFHYPVAFMTEPGFWMLTDAEAEAFRAYLLKGGFVIFDDFRDSRGGGGWAQFESNMHRILPNAQIVPMDIADPIFHCFFDIESLGIIPQAYSEAGPPQITGIYEDNDRSKRLLAIINYNVDISDFWQYSADGVFPVENSNEAYKLGVNYVIYGLTH